MREIRPFLERDRAEDTDEAKLSQAATQGFFAKWDILVVDEGQALAESWHRVLGDTFADGHVYVFCDDAQRFEFEEGASSTGICEAYRMPPAFHLTHCLRNPFQINQLLQDLIPPAFQLTCPRPREVDALTELVAVDLQQDLADQLDTLLRESIAPEDITVLYPYDRPYAVEAALADPRFEAIRCVNVAAFRGMESRVVVLVVDRQLGSELPVFSAYSRATSRCVAIYAYDLLRDALRGGGSSNRSRHVRQLAQKSRVALQEVANELARESYFRTFRDTRKLEINSAHVYWHDRWRCWLVESQENEPAGFFWADHLCQYPWRVVFKSSNISMPYVYEGDRRLTEDGKVAGYLKSSICDECCMETGWSDGMGCMVCASHRQPYRLRKLISSLAEQHGQIFLTTHSPVAISCATNGHLWYLDSRGAIGSLPGDKISSQQKRDPETFLSRVAVIAEGPTEVGFLQYLLERAFGGNPLDYGVRVRCCPPLRSYCKRMSWWARSIRWRSGGERPGEFAPRGGCAVDHLRSDVGHDPGRIRRERLGGGECTWRFPRQHQWSS